MAFFEARLIARRFLASETGQDLVEYALLTAFIGLAGAGAVGLVLEALRLGYLGWDANTQNLWVPDDPAGS